MDWENLYITLKNDRDELPNFLKKNCDYAFLKNLLIEIENNKEHGKNKNIIKKLFLGKCGLESNKQKAIYELPTNELLKIIKFICEYLNVNIIEELASGQGLLSHMLEFKLGNSYTINATDGLRNIETSNKNKYFNVQNKMFLNYCLDDTNFDNKLVIISWTPLNDYVDLCNLLRIKKPENIIIIGDKHNKLFNKFKELNYECCIIQAKQLCFKDYFKNNIISNDETITSSILFATLKQDIHIKTLLLNIKLKLNDCLLKINNNNSDKIIIQNAIRKMEIEYILPMITDDNIKEIVRMTCDINKYQFQIPNFIKNYDELIIWYNLEKKRKYPTNIKTKKKFKEFMSYNNKLNSDGGLDELKNKGVLSNWVTDIQMASKFIWLDYSTINKKWKHSIQEFQNEFLSRSTRTFML